jgi:hypothetical protein
MVSVLDLEMSGVKVAIYSQPLGARAWYMPAPVAVIYLPKKITILQALT